MNLALRIAAIVLFLLGLLVGLGWIDLTSNDWNPGQVFLFGGLICWCLSDTVPMAVTRRQT